MRKSRPTLTASICPCLIRPWMAGGDTRIWAAHSLTSMNTGSPSPGGSSPEAGLRAGALPGSVPASARTAGTAGTRVSGRAYARGLRAGGGAFPVPPPAALAGGLTALHPPRSSGAGAAGGGVPGGCWS